MHLHVKLARVALGLILLFGAACATAQRRTGVEGLPADKLKELGEKYLVAGNMEQALKYLGDAEKKTPNDPQIQYDFGLAYGALRQPDKALAYFQQALALKPDYAEAYNALGALHAEQGRSEEAREAFSRALAVPTYKTPYFAHFNLGRLYEKEGNPSQAIDEYKEAVNLNSQYFSAYLRMGALLESQSRYDEALQAYRDAISVSPDNVEAQYAFGRLCYDVGDLRSATAAFNKVVRLAPYSSMAVSAREHLDQMHPPVDLTTPKVGRGSKNDATKSQAAKEIAKLQAEIQQQIKGPDGDRAAPKLTLPQPRPQPDGGRQASNPASAGNQSTATLRNTSPTGKELTVSSPQPAQPAAPSEPKNMEPAQAKAVGPVDRSVARSVDGVTQMPVASVEPKTAPQTESLSTGEGAGAKASATEVVKPDQETPVPSAKTESSTGEQSPKETAAPMDASVASSSGSTESGAQARLSPDHAIVREQAKAGSEENAEQAAPTPTGTKGEGGASTVSASEVKETASGSTGEGQAAQGRAQSLAPAERGAPPEKAASAGEPAAPVEAPREEAQKAPAEKQTAGASGAEASARDATGASESDASASAAASSSDSGEGVKASQETETKSTAKAPETEIAAVEREAPKAEEAQKGPEPKAAPTANEPAESAATQANAEPSETAQVPKASEAPEAETASEAAESPSVETGSAPATGKSPYVVQAGIFRNEQNAKKVRDRLKAKGYAVVLKSVPSRTYGVMYKVLIEPAGGAEDARKVAERIRTEEKLEPLLLRSR